MANLALLLTSGKRPSSAVDEAGDTIRESRYTVPPFWLAAFDSDCVENFWDEDDELSIPVLISTCSEALNRLPQRLNAMRTDFDIPEHYFSVWIDFVASLHDPFLICLVDEIVFMDDEGLQDLVPALNYFRGSTVGSKESMQGLSNLSDTLDRRQLVEREGDGLLCSTSERLMGYDA